MLTSLVNSEIRSPLAHSLGIGLNFYNKSLTEIIIPEDVKHVDCSRNQLTKIIFLQTLKHLDCFDNKLITLPPLLNLVSLNCSMNETKELPDLPKCLRYLSCDYNYLTKLPELPKTLRVLSCRFNKITELFLPDNLHALCCEGNLIKHIEIPFGLERLNYKDCKEEKLRQHNKKRLELGLFPIRILNKKVWKKINEQYLIFLYQPDSEKYLKAEQNFKDLLKD